MQATFPALVRLGGIEWFNQMARAFQRVSPSRSGDLNGRRLRLPSLPLGSLEQRPSTHILVDVALLEWSYQQCPLRICRAAGKTIDRLSLPPGKRISAQLSASESQPPDTCPSSSIVILSSRFGTRIEADAKRSEAIDLGHGRKAGCWLIRRIRPCRGTRGCLRPSSHSVRVRRRLDG